MKTIATFIWDTSEYLNINLGRFAPWVFEKMIGVKGRLINPETTIYYE